MELKLHDNSRLHFDWTNSGSLYVQLYQPGFLRAGHGLLLVGTALLADEELSTFLSALVPTEREAA